DPVAGEREDQLQSGATEYVEEYAEVNLENADDVQRLQCFGVTTRAVAVRSIPLCDIDDSDQSLQFRFSSKSKQLKRSLQKEGQLAPIRLVVSPSAESYRIIDGFCRVLAAKELGWTAIQALLYQGADD